MGEGWICDLDEDVDVNNIVRKFVLTAAGSEIEALRISRELDMESSSCLDAGLVMAVEVASIAANTHY